LRPAAVIALLLEGELAAAHLQREQRVGARCERVVMEEWSLSGGRNEDCDKIETSDSSECEVITKRLHSAIKALRSAWKVIVVRFQMIAIDREAIGRHNTKVHTS
jgi:hypothetical protein